MTDDDNYEIPVRSMDWVLGIQEWSHEHTTYFEFIERHLQKLNASVKDYA